MAQKGYWAVCEEIRPKSTSGKKPIAYFVHIPGFFYADVMAETQFEAMNRARDKLKENIEFLSRCYCEIPQPQSAAQAPDEKFPDGSILFFIALEEIQIEEYKVESAA